MAHAFLELTPRTALAPYDGFDKMPVGGTWRHGRSGRAADDLDPYTNDVLVRIPLATRRTWTRRTGPPRRRSASWADWRPAERSAVLRRAAAIMEARREEIVDWLVRESGSTRIKANLEWGFTHAMTLEAASFPSRAGGAHPADRRRGQGEPRLPAAGRRGRHDQPVELPAAPEQPVHRPRAGAGQRGRDQARLGHAGDRRAAARQDLRGGGPPPRRAQRGDRRGAARSASGSCSIRCRA